MMYGSYYNVVSSVLVNLTGGLLNTHYCVVYQYVDGGRYMIGYIAKELYDHNNSVISDHFNSEMLIFISDIEVKVMINRYGKTFAVGFFDRNIDNIIVDLTRCFDNSFGQIIDFRKVLGDVIKLLRIIKTEQNFKKELELSSSSEINDSFINDLEYFVSEYKSSTVDVSRRKVLKRLIDLCEGHNLFLKTRINKEYE